MYNALNPPPLSWSQPIKYSETSLVCEKRKGAMFLLQSFSYIYDIGNIY